MFEPLLHPWFLTPLLQTGLLLFCVGVLIALAIAGLFDYAGPGLLLCVAPGLLILLVWFVIFVLTLIANALYWIWSPAL